MKRIIVLIFLICFKNFYAEVNDDTNYLQNEINKLNEGDIFDGKGRIFYVTSIWLKSDIIIKNLKLISIPTFSSDVSVLCIGNDLKTNSYNRKKEALLAFKNSSNLGINNILIENISIDGNRINQPFSITRDGGKHGISIKGFVNNIVIRNVLIQNCVTDGVSIYRGLHTSLDMGGREMYAANNIFLENVISENNGRHGGSGDSIKGLVCRYSKFRNNGKDFIIGTKNSKGWYYNGKQYGNGWDMEGYGVGSGIKDIEFNNTEFVNNVGAGLVFYDTVDSRNRIFTQRENLKIFNCNIDSGTSNPSGEFSLIFSSTIEYKKNKPIYNNIYIKDSNLQGRFLCRSCGIITFENNFLNSISPYKMLLDNVDVLKIKSKIMPLIERNELKKIEIL